MFQDFPSQLPGYEDLPPLSFLLTYQLSYIDWVLISAKSVEDCISMEKLNTLNTDLQSILQNITKFAAGQTRPILTNTRNSRSHEFCREFCGIFLGHLFDDDNGDDDNDDDDDKLIIMLQVSDFASFLKRHSSAVVFQLILGNF